MKTTLNMQTELKQYTLHHEPFGLSSEAFIYPHWLSNKHFLVRTDCVNNIDIFRSEKTGITRSLKSIQRWCPEIEKIHIMYEESQILDLLPRCQESMHEWVITEEIVGLPLRARVLFPVDQKDMIAFIDLAYLDMFGLKPGDNLYTKGRTNTEVFFDSSEREAITLGIMPINPNCQNGLEAEKKYLGK